MKTLEEWFDTMHFEPNPAQRQAITHRDGPLYLIAGPGSGKTRVLLWRTVNLIVYRNVSPDRIFLSTFTEKAAKQLRDGLANIVNRISQDNGQHYDMAGLYVGTVHSLCRRLLLDRELSPNRMRTNAPILMDELDQYFFMYRTFWDRLVAASKLKPTALAGQITALFGQHSESQHNAVVRLIAIFNRWSEEHLTPEKLHAQPGDSLYHLLVDGYGEYLRTLNDSPARVDLSVLQALAYERIIDAPGGGTRFDHIIIDEYQDTNAIQESLFFRLAEGSQNLCIVGDDDQSLYRFRGATVENFVSFPERCERHFGMPPTPIKLETNYRSKPDIVSFYGQFVDAVKWSDRNRMYRQPKTITASDHELGQFVYKSAGASEDVSRDVAQLTKRLLDEKVVEDPSQVAFLFPSLKSVTVERMRRALEEQGLKVYAPRASVFLDNPEPSLMIGMMAEVLGIPEDHGWRGGYHRYHEWLRVVNDAAALRCQQTPELTQFVSHLKGQIAQAVTDYELLESWVAEQGWELQDSYVPDLHQRKLAACPGLSERCRGILSYNRLAKAARKRIEEGRPYTLSYWLSRATALSWNVLDLFYRLLGFPPFREWLDDAETGTDEGPAQNLAYFSQYLSRFLTERGPMLSGREFTDNRFVNSFFGSFFYALYRLGETEYEDPENPFPRGRIPFLTIHQAKGLEFPVVVLGNVGRKRRDPGWIEEVTRPLVDREQEPIDRIDEFDGTRMFYVALSRAQKLLVVAQHKGSGAFEPFKRLLPRLPDIADLDIARIERQRLSDEAVSHVYSFTADYQLYSRCPRRYMMFRQLGFVPYRSQSLFFGNVVHQTLEDLHNYLIAQRAEGGNTGA